MNFLNSFKNYWVIWLNNLILLIYLIVIGVLAQNHIADEIFIVKLWNIDVNLSWVMLLMFIFETLSTLTFQLRIQLTAKFENKPNKTLISIISFIGGLSWCIAGTQGIILISSSGDNLIRDIIKFVPVFIATFNGIQISLKSQYLKLQQEKESKENEPSKENL